MGFCTAVNEVIDRKYHANIFMISARYCKCVMCEYKEPEKRQGEGGRVTLEQFYKSNVS